MIRTADPAVAPCSLHRRHNPKPRLTVYHHVIPESWTTYLGIPAGPTIPVCGTGHDNIHVALRQWVIRGERPHHLPRRERQAVQTAYDYWMANPQLHAKHKILLAHP